MFNQVLMLIDASFGFEMETFEFLNICQVHGFPRIMGVLTHLDSFRNNKALRKNKKRLKHRFWTEVYQVNTKIFYLWLHTINRISNCVCKVEGVSANSLLKCRLVQVDGSVQVDSLGLAAQQSYGLEVEAVSEPVRPRPDAQVLPAGR